jgi:formiminotetrahydrofolate cyclodeaminase
MIDQNSSIEQFLQAAAAKQPTPGGGSVAALAGALAAAMGEMAANYSVGKKGSEQHADVLKAALGEFQRARNLLIALMSEDQAAYEAMSAARKMPESPQKAEAFSVALLACVRVPQSMAAASLAMLDLAEKLINIANPLLLSDLAVCAELAMATVRCALYNVRVNLPDVSDATERQRIESTSQQLLSRATQAIQRTIPAIWKRLSNRPGST